MKRLMWSGAAVLAIVLTALLGYWAFRTHYHRGNNLSARSTSSVTHKSAPLARLTAGYLVSGDVFWGRGIDMFAQESPLKEDWPFSRLNEFHPENYNGWIADMECPVNNTYIPYQVQVDSLVFACPTKYLPAAAKYFSAMTLANNHTDNTGRSGFVATQTNLAAAGIQPFGDYDLSQTDNLCEVVSLNATANGQPVKLPIAMCGYHWLAREPTDAELAKITEYAKYFPVWVFPHGGTEYDTSYTPQQQDLYHKFIDAGASAVFGDHPHVVEPTESYRGKLIVYDLGNLIFDQWFDSEVTKNLVLAVSVSASVDANFQKYLSMGQVCAAFKDNCLQKAEQAGLTAYKLQYSYNITAGDSKQGTLDERAKHLGGPAVQQWLLHRADWANTLAGLSAQPY